MIKIHIYIKEKKTLPEQNKWNTFEHRLILVILYNISYVTLHVLSSQKTYNHTTTFFVS